VTRFALSMRRRPAPLRSLLVLACAGLAACASTTTINNYQRARIGAIGPGERLVVLSEYQNVAVETEGEFIGCVGDSLRESGYEIEVIDHRAFIDGMYPYFEAGTAPTSVQAISTLSQDPVAQARMSDLNVRYLVWVEGDTATIDKNGSMSCTISPAGGGCFGWASWTNHGFYNAKIWDLKLGIEASTFDIDAKGTSHLIGVVVPIPLLANVESSACKALAHWIAFAVQGG